MNTLVISDLHLGQGGGVSVLTRPRPLAVLLEALDHHDRLVLLGDIVELLETHSAISFPVAEPVLRAIAERLGPSKKLILVPGNHDHGLLRNWARAQGEQLGREALVPVDASPLLAELVSWLAATRVEVHYPGLWLGDEVWATHGHYLNHFMRPVSSWGLHSRSRPQLTTAAAFEYIISPPAPHMRDGLPPERWLDRHIPTLLAPLTSRALSHQMQRHALPALARCASALGVDARFLVFGHVHRPGPRDGDDLRLWSGSGGAPQVLNTGSWRYEPVVARGMGAAGQYWPGGAVTLGDDGIPRSARLLDDLTEADMTGEPEAR